MGLAIMSCRPRFLATDLEHGAPIHRVRHPLTSRLNATPLAPRTLLRVLLEGQFAYFARALGRVGASGVVIEDKRVPKRNSLDENNATSHHQTMGTVLASRGFDIIIYGNHMLRAAHRAIARVAEAIPEHDRSPEAGELCTTVPELFALVGYNDVGSWRPSSAPRSPSQ
jgi:hypothetical protein